MKAIFAALALLATVAPGCGSSTVEQPLPTVDADGTLTVPAGYTPGPKTDLSRVDCPRFLAMTPVDMRVEMKRLCESSATPDERARNPMCEGHRITQHCERG